jgi:Zn-dependent M28 family amino/carboxypeptidase
MKKEALRKEFKPVPLGATATFRVRNTWKAMGSHNVVARIEGSDPDLKDEVVVYTAHWDHFGWDPRLPGDEGRNRCTTAHATTRAAWRPCSPWPRHTGRCRASETLDRLHRDDRGGALAARRRPLREHPIYPLSRTLAVINSDGLNAWGRTSDAVIVGHGHSTLDEIITDVAATQGRVTMPDPRPETGGFFRSDQLPFVRAGVPSGYFGGGREFIGKPSGFHEQKRNEYVTNRYHKVADVVEPAWDLSGAVSDVLLSFQVGLRVAEGTTYPQWKADSEFRAKRDR